MSSGCISCPDPIGPCPTCPKGQVCQQISQSCQTCAKRVCVAQSAVDGSGAASSGSGPSTGATVGGAVGGIVGVAAILAAVYFFWWRPKGLAASRKRYSQHLAKRQSKGAEKRKTLQPGDAAAGAGAGAKKEGETDRATKRTSVHLNLGAPGDGSGISRRNSPAREGGALITGRTSEEDDPFGDQDRSSIGTFNDASSVHESEFSFRSNVIPIAYIPPHSSSVSISDAQRGAYGETDSEPAGAALPARSAAGLRASVPASMASRDSLALAGAELIELNPLPPVLIPDHPAVPHGATANGAPIRPPRSPGLDLNLPKISSPLASSSTTDLSGGGGENASGGSSPTHLAPGSTLPPAGRSMSVLMEQSPARARSAQSHLSTFTTRSGNSTMSYILDPPQIITPVSAQGARRVELQKGQAGLVKIGASTAPSPMPGLAAAAAVPLPISPVSPTESVNPFDDANEEKRLSGTAPPSVFRQSARPMSSATDTSRWTSSSFASDALEGGVQFLQGQTVTFTNPNSALLTPATGRTASGVSFDVPTSARSSEAFETGSAPRTLTNQTSAWSLSTVKPHPVTPQAANMSPSLSRDSAASVSTNGTHVSALEGIPFLAPTAEGATSGGQSDDGVPRQASTSSVSLGLPENVTSPGEGPTSPARGNGPTAPPVPFVSPTMSSSHPAQEDADDDDALPAPFLPFAGQRPTSAVSEASTARPGGRADPNAPTGTDRVQSTAISIRSGFGSGLSQIPFQIGFPSGFGEGEGEELEGDDRRSMLSRDSRFPPSENGEEENFSSDATRDTSLTTSAAHSPRTAGASKDDVSDPFGSHAEIDHRPVSLVADPRASVDSLALAVGLSATLEAQAAGQS